MPASTLIGMKITLITVNCFMVSFWLILMKPTVASIRKFILTNNNEVSIQRFNVPQYLVGFLVLLFVQETASHQERNRTASIQHIAAY